MTRLRFVGKLILWHYLLFATVYLPVYAISRVFVLAFVSDVPLAASGWGNEAAEVVFICFVLGYLMVPGVAAHVAGVLLLWAVAGDRTARVGAVLLAAVVPLTPVLLGWIWVQFIVQPFVDTLVATVAYGMACQFALAKLRRPGKDGVLAS